VQFDGTFRLTLYSQLLKFQSRVKTSSFKRNTSQNLIAYLLQLVLIQPLNVGSSQEFFFLCNGTQSRKPFPVVFMQLIVVSIVCRKALSMLSANWYGWYPANETWVGHCFRLCGSGAKFAQYFFVRAFFCFHRDHYHREDQTQLCEAWFFTSGTCPCLKTLTNNMYSYCVWSPSTQSTGLEFRMVYLLFLRTGKSDTS
jgi:hypothetical protein